MGLLLFALIGCVTDDSHMRCSEGDAIASDDASDLGFSPDDVLDAVDSRTYQPTAVNDSEGSVWLEGAGEITVAVTGDPDRSPMAMRPTGECADDTSLDVPVVFRVTSADGTLDLGVPGAVQATGLDDASMAWRTIDEAPSGSLPASLQGHAEELADDCSEPSAYEAHLSLRSFVEAPRLSLEVVVDCGRRTLGAGGARAGAVGGLGGVRIPPSSATRAPRRRG